MFLALWEYEVKPGSEERFEKVYGPEGDWARLFQKDSHYHQTRLVRDVPWRRPRDIAGLVRKFVFAPLDAVVRTFDDDLIAFGSHHREQAVGVHDA